MLKITAASHVDHGLTEDMLQYIIGKFADKQAFFIETIELPEELGKVECNLHGPAVGEPPVRDEEAKDFVRGARTWLSRGCVTRTPAHVRTVTVVAGPHEGDACVLYTAYGGPLAPREPGDPAIKDEAELAKSREFWAEHALGI